MNDKLTVYINLRRFDLSDNPEIESKTLELNVNLDYNNLKSEVKNLCNVKEHDSKVIKIRNKDLALIPLNNLLEGNTKDNPFVVDITRVSYASKNATALLQDAYLDAVRKNIRSMECRVTQAELLIPQLQYRRQAHMEQTVNSMSSRVAFLNRRIDELMPPQWKAKMPMTIS